MKTMKKLFKYFIIVLVFYIFTNIVTSIIMKPEKTESSDGAETVASVDFDWEELSKDPMFWFIALGGIIATLP